MEDREYHGANGHCPCPSRVQKDGGILRYRKCTRTGECHQYYRKNKFIGGQRQNECQQKNAVHSKQPAGGIKEFRKQVKQRCVGKNPQQHACR